MRIVRLMLQHVGNNDQRLRSFFHRSAGETFDRNALNRLHDRGGFARQRPKPDLQSVFERFAKSVQPSLLRQRGVRGILAQAGPVAWITSGKERLAACDLRVQQPQLQQAVGRQGLGNVRQCRLHFALGDFRDVVGRIEKHHGDGTGPIHRAERGAIKCRRTRRSRIDVGTRRNRAERKQRQCRSNRVLAQIARIPTTPPWRSTWQLSSPPRVRQSRGSWRMPARIRRGWPALERRVPPAIPRSTA